MPLTEMDRLLMRPITSEDLDRIEKEVQQDDILCQIFKAPFFGRVRGEIRAHENGTSTSYSNIFSILDLDDRRRTLSLFLGLIKNKMESGNWKHLCQRITSDDANNTSLKALFEVVIIGNLLNQLPDESVVLDANTIDNKDCDIRVKLVDRDVDIEVTMVDESEHAKKWHEHSGVIVRAIAPSIISGRRVIRSMEEKANDFRPNNPNVLITQLFDWRERTPIAMANIRRREFKNIGLFVPCNRNGASRERIMNFDPACGLTEEETAILLDILCGKDFVPLSYV